MAGKGIRFERTPFKGLAGDRFHSWTVLRYAHSVQYRGGTVFDFWICRCACGVERTVNGDNLQNGRSQCCGCIGDNALGERHLTHGMSRQNRRLYNVWHQMMARCYNEKQTVYRHYGGRGIRVCERWQSVEAFVQDMAPSWKSGLTLERDDVNGNYEPSNCRWATRKEQSNNTRRNKVYTLHGKTMNLTQWAEYLGVKRTTLERRLRLGWGIHATLTESVRRS